MFCDSKIAEKLLNVSERTLLRYRKQNKLLEGIHWGKNPSGNPHSADVCEIFLSVVKSWSQKVFPFNLCGFNVTGTC